MKLYLIPAFLLLLVSNSIGQPAPATSIAPAWQPFGPEGGSVADVIRDPYTGLLYAAAKRTIYRSTDNGTTWRRADFLVLNNNCTIWEIYAVPGALLASQYYSPFASPVFRSTDSGRTWREANTRMHHWRRGIATFAYAGGIIVTRGVSADTISMSVDSGFTWQPFAAEPKGTFAITTDGTRLFALSDSGLFHLRTDGRALPYGPTGVRIGAFVFQNGTACAAGDSTLYFSENNGLTWKQREIMEVRYNPRIGLWHNREFFVLTPHNGMLAVSHNWQRRYVAEQTEGPPPRLERLYAINDIILAGGPDGLYRFDSIGATTGAAVLGHWTPMYAGWNDTDIEWMEPIGDTILAGGYETLYRSVDAGSHWQRVDALNNGGVLELLVQGKDVYAISSVGYQLFRSTNAGATWYQQKFGTWEPQCQSLSVSGTTINVVAADGIFHSANNGATWKFIHDPFTSYFVDNVAGEGKYIFATVYCHECIVEDSYRSANNGRTWRAVEVMSVRRFIQRPGIIYALTYNDGVHYTRNNGKTWTAINDGLGTWGKDEDMIPDVETLDVRGKTLYATSDVFAHTDTIYTSQSNGKKWQKSLPPNNVRIQTLCPTRNGLLVGTFYNGIFRRNAVEE